MTDFQGGPTILSLRETMDRLASPYGAEGFSVLEGEGVLVVDLPTESGISIEGGSQRALARALSQLACPTIAISNASLSPVATALLPAFDVVLDGLSGVRTLCERIRRHPIASLALVQLLRQSGQLDVPSGLVAESWVYSVLQSGPEFQAWLMDRSPQEVFDSPQPAVLMDRGPSKLCLKLNRPARRNAFGVGMRDGLAEGLQLALSDPEIQEIVLSGEGTSFCSGGDLSEFGSLPDPATAHAVRSTRNVARMLDALASRTRAKVHGACIGAGVELPSFVHEVAAREDSFFQLPEIKMGLVPGAGGTVSLPRRIGRQRTAWLALTGERIDVHTAAEWGLVDRILSPGDWDSER